MPSRYVVRSFTENCFYHVFNRGVEKRNIFQDQQDYKIFQYYLGAYLLPPHQAVQIYPKLPLRLQSKNLNQELDLVAYCLMPNHFHLLLKQTNPNAISRFMKQLTNAYTFYFNNKYKRVGGLMQGRFKAVSIDSDELLLHISRYIHLNPLVANLTKDLEDYLWSSYKDYLAEKEDGLCKKESVLGNFSSQKDYERFVLDQEDYGRKLEKIKHFILD